MTKISIYKTSQFTSKGRIKKNAKPEYITEVRDYKADVMAKYLKYLGYTGFSSPYFFSHIQAVNHNNEPVRIFQDVLVGSDQKWLITSPTTLLSELMK